MTIPDNNDNNECDTAQLLSYDILTRFDRSQYFALSFPAEAKRNVDVDMNSTCNDTN